MPDANALRRADNAIRSSVAQTTRLVSLRDAQGKQATRALLTMLEQSDRALAARLRVSAVRLGGLSQPFSIASAEVYRLQNKIVTDYVKRRLLGLTHAQAIAAITASARASVQLLATLEMQFSGIAVPLRLSQAAALNPLITGVRSSLLAQQATSVERYGVAIIAKTEQIIRTGLLSGATNRDIVQTLTGQGVAKAEGVFVGHKAWAERIVRTETAHASEEAKAAVYREARQDIPDLSKKIIAHFDARTAPDSVAVHGQIRGPDEMFVDGAGRHYLRPPGRPNDRETTIPWRTRWPETETTRPKDSAEVARAIAQSTPGGAAARRQTAQQRAVARANAAARARMERAAQKQAKKSAAA